MTSAALIFTDAHAQAAGGAPAGSILEPILLIVVMFAIMYFLVIRPQQRKAKEHAEMLGALRRGDEVVTGGGLIGKVVKVRDDDEEVEIEIGRAGSEPVRARVVRAMIANVTSKSEPAKSGASGGGSGSGGGGKKKEKVEKSAPPANDDRPKSDGSDADADDAKKD